MLHEMHIRSQAGPIAAYIVHRNEALSPDADRSTRVSSALASTETPTTATMPTAQGVSAHSCDHNADGSGGQVQNHDGDAAYFERIGHRHVDCAGPLEEDVPQFALQMNEIAVSHSQHASSSTARTRAGTGNPRDDDTSASSLSTTLHVEPARLPQAACVADLFDDSAFVHLNASVHSHRHPGALYHFPDTALG